MHDIPSSFFLAAEAATTVICRPNRRDLVLIENKKNKFEKKTTALGTFSRALTKAQLRRPQKASPMEQKKDRPLKPVFPKCQPRRKNDDPKNPAEAVNPIGLAHAHFLVPHQTQPFEVVFGAMPLQMAEEIEKINRQIANSLILDDQESFFFLDKGLFKGSHFFIQKSSTRKKQLSITVKGSSSLAQALLEQHEPTLKARLHQKNWALTILEFQPALWEHPEVAINT